MTKRKYYLTTETKKRIRLSKLGSKNPMWKGHDAQLTYTGLHRRIETRLPRPELCPMCTKRSPFDIANITGIYDHNLENWRWLCRKCHMLSDGRIKNNLVQNQSYEKRKNARVKSGNTNIKNNLVIKRDLITGRFIKKSKEVVAI